ncbi:MAG: insulinase family protein [Gemmatimonadota bacterium]|nr:insulinase family protein [Gemmatimonadota bacterium]
MRHLWAPVSILRAATTLAVAGAIGCAHAPPEQAMSVVTAEGRLMPLDSATVSYRVGGLRVIQRPNYANDAVAVNLYLLGGTRQLTRATQGIESLLLRTGEYGTRKYPGNGWRSAWRLTGSRMVVATEADWTVYGFLGIRQEFDPSWDAFADRLMHPTLASASLDVVRARLIAENRAMREQPDADVMRIADSIAFANHPYGMMARGTEAALASLDSEQVAAYSADQITTSRMLLVVVGNVTRAQVEAAVSRTLVELPAGHYVWTLPPPAPAFQSSVDLVSRVIPTNYVVGIFRGPPAASRDAPAFRVTLALLSSAMNSTIRHERGLSYAANATDVERGATAGVVYVSTGAPRAVMPLISTPMEFLRHFPGEIGNLHGFTDQFIMEYFADNMTDASQADFLARAQLYQGDFRKASESMESLRHVTANNVRDMAQEYFHNIHFVYLGDTTLVRRSDFTTSF